MTTRVPAVLAVLFAGCAVSTGGNVSFHDAGHDSAMRGDAGLATADAADAGPTDDVGTDAGAEDAASDGGSDGGSDAGTDGGGDAGHDAAVLTPPTVDGVVGGTEWAAATSASSSTATIWAGDQLTTLRAIALGGTLYIAIEGQIESHNGMVVYIDGDPGGAHGVFDLVTLTDATGEVDDAISAGFTQPAGFRADVAWGTTVMSHIVSGADNTTGFRDISVSPSNFAWLSGTQTACTSGACEASISTSALGPGPAPRAIQLFARIVDPMGMHSPNQTLPMDDPSMPRIVSVVLSIHE